MVLFCGQQAFKNTTSVVEQRTDILGVHKILSYIKIEDLLWIRGRQVLKRNTFIFQTATALPGHTILYQQFLNFGTL